MNINYSSKHMEITSAMETLFTKKLTRLEKYFADDTVAYVHITNRKNTQKLEITIPVKGSTIRSEQEGPDVYNLIDKEVDALERQIKKYRGKLQDTRRAAGSVKPGYEPQPEAAEEDDIRIEKRKTFAMKPQSAEEACLQMELLGHNFYVFLNSETNEINVVYRRNNGGYGLIEPTLAEE